MQDHSYQDIREAVRALCAKFPDAGACHGQMYNMGTLLRHGSIEQKVH